MAQQEEWIGRHLDTHPASSRSMRTTTSANSALGVSEYWVSRSSRPFRDRPAYATTVENSVYVCRAARGRGVGEVLLRQLMALAGESAFTR